VRRECAAFVRSPPGGVKEFREVDEIPLYRNNFWTIRNCPLKIKTGRKPGFDRGIFQIFDSDGRRLLTL
jgi:hypothetical protein